MLSCSVFRVIFCIASTDAAGMLALGAAERPDAQSAKRDLQTAKELTATCVAMYTNQKSGLAPDSVRFQPGASGSMFVGGRENFQRPVRHTLVHG
eukprot:SAG31_NODE_5795_length_2325_cov_1.352201_1_plen_95_part_00